MGEELDGRIAIGRGADARLLSAPSQAFFSLPSKIGVTATLSLSYKKPTFAEQYLVMRTETVDVKGRKVWVKGRVETLDGQTLVEAE